MSASTSLLTGFVPVAIAAFAAATLLGSVAWQRRAGLLRQLLIGLPAAAVATALLASALALFGVVPEEVPGTISIWVGFILLAIALGVTGWRWTWIWQRVVACVAVVATTLAAGMLVNLSFQYLPTVGSLFGVSAQHLTTVRDLNKMRGPSTGGTQLGYTVQIAIPGTKSGFKAREAYVWVPPVWFTQPQIKLPVIELLSGVPGTPADWTRSNDADTTAQAFADAHGGVAPILVMPDPNGSLTGDTECVNSPRGNAETYLTQDVPTFVKQTFGAASGPDHWAIGGLSAGGECSLMLALRHPDLYSTFADFSGLEGPTVGDVMEPAQTTQALFGGSAAAYQAHLPANLLRTAKYPGLGGWFEVGSADLGPYAAQQMLVPLARAASITTCAAVIPGGQHNFEAWSQSFRDSLPWIAHRLDVGPAPASTTPASCS